MKHTMLLMLAAASACTVSAQKADGAVYVTTAAKDTVAVNLVNNPTIALTVTTSEVSANGNVLKQLSLYRGLKITFGKELLMGDANRDEKVTVEDAKVIADDFVGKETNIDRNSADVNLDGKVDMDDANKIVNQTVK